MATLRWHRTGDLLISCRKTRSMASERVMVSTISLIQANLKHRTAASRVLTRTVAVKGIDMALI